MYSSITHSAVPAQNSSRVPNSLPGGGTGIWGIRVGAGVAVGGIGIEVGVGLGVGVDVGVAVGVDVGVGVAVGVGVGVCVGVGEGIEV